MKMPTLNRPAKPDPKVMYQTCTGFVVDTPTLPNWAPPVGAKVRGDSPMLQYMWSIGASRYFVTADADAAEFAAAANAATYPTETTPTPDPTIKLGQPSEHLMVCTRAIQVGESMIARGTLADRDSQFVKAFPDAWENAPAPGYTA